MPTHRSIRHDRFTLERTYPHRPERVFFALTDPNAKAGWFGHPDADPVESSIDLRVGGREVQAGRMTDGDYRFVATYHDIVPAERIIYSYEMYSGGVKLSVSQTCIELIADGTGTRLAYSEYGAYLDGHDEPEFRLKGTEDLLDALGAALAATER